ncbi:MAG: carboxypeptidase regulatory-like domain-containing protein, partial [Planctomycetota bacterium]
RTRVRQRRALARLGGLLCGVGLGLWLLWLGGGLVASRRIDGTAFEASRRIAAAGAGWAAAGSRLTGPSRPAAEDATGARSAAVRRQAPGRSAAAAADAGDGLRVHGRVFDAESDRPLPGAMVYAVAFDRIGARWHGGSSPLARTDSAGRFSFVRPDRGRALGPVLLQLFVRQPGYEPLLVLIGEEVASAELPVPLRPGGGFAVVGHVEDAETGARLPDVPVRLVLWSFRPSGQLDGLPAVRSLQPWPYAIDLRTGPRGELAVDGLPQGWVQLVSRDPSWHDDPDGWDLVPCGRRRDREVRWQLAGPGRPAPVRLRCSERILGRLPPGMPLPPLRVRARVPLPDGTIVHFGGKNPTDASWGKSVVTGGRLEIYHPVFPQPRVTLRLFVGRRRLVDAAGREAFELLRGPAGNDLGELLLAP